MDVNHINKLVQMTFDLHKTSKDYLQIIVTENQRLKQELESAKLHISEESRSFKRKTEKLHLIIDNQQLENKRLKSELQSLREFKSSNVKSEPGSNSINADGTQKCVTEGLAQSVSAHTDSEVLHAVACKNLDDFKLNFRGSSTSIFSKIRAPEWENLASKSTEDSLIPSTSIATSIFSKIREPGWENLAHKPSDDVSIPSTSTTHLPYSNIGALGWENLPPKPSEDVPIPSTSAEELVVEARKALSELSGNSQSGIQVISSDEDEDEEKG